VARLYARLSCRLSDLKPVGYTLVTVWVRSTRSHLEGGRDRSATLGDDQVLVLSRKRELSLIPVAPRYNTEATLALYKIGLLYGGAVAVSKFGRL
jgi:hypothetical protein